MRCAWFHTRITTVLPNRYPADAVSNWVLARFSAAPVAVPVAWYAAASIAASIVALSYEAVKLNRMNALDEKLTIATLVLQGH